MNISNLLNYFNSNIKNNIQINNNTLDGFFIDFLLSCPKDKLNLVDIKIEEPVENEKIIISTIIKPDNYNDWIWKINGTYDTFLYIEEFRLVFFNKNNEIIISANACAKLHLFGTGKLVDVNLNFENGNFPSWQVSIINDPKISFLSYYNVGQMFESIPFFLPENNCLNFPTAKLKKTGKNQEDFDFKITFFPNKEIDCEYNFGVDIMTYWEIIENVLKLEDFSIHSYITSTSYQSQIMANVNICDKKLQLGLDIRTGYIWSGFISAKRPEDFPGVFDISEYFFKKSGIQALQNINFDCNSSNFYIKSFSFEVDFYRKSLHFFSILCRTKFLNLEFDFAIEVKPELKIIGCLNSSNNVYIRDVLTSCNFGSVDVFNGIIIKEATLLANPKYSIYSISFDLSGEILSISELQLKELKFKIYYNDGIFNGEIDAVLQIGEDIQLNVSSSNEDGWLFTGSFYCVGSGLKPTEILNKLVSQFGFSNIILPNWAKNLEINDLQISVNSTHGDYTFGMELIFPLEDKKEKIEKKIIVLLKVVFEKGKWCLKGDINLKTIHFEVDVNSEKDTKIVAKLNSGNEITINEILTELGLQDNIRLPDAIDIGFNEATIEFETSEKNKCLVISASKGLDYFFCLIATKLNGKWIYTTKVGINAIKLHLNQIPLVGSEISEDTGVKNIFLLGLSDSLENDAIKKLNLLIEKTEHQLPTEYERLEKGVYLNMLLDLGNGNSYPIQVSTAGKKIKKENNKQLFLGEEPVNTKEKPSITWKKIDKKAGPLQLNKIGFGFQNNELNLYFDATFIAGPLTLYLDDLQLTSSITEFKPHASLNGLSLKYSSKSIQIGGSFKKDKSESYSGLALIGTKAFQLAAIGAFAKVDGETSLFVYAMLNKDIGGPSQFYIKGIASGFGYNRNLLLPSLDNVIEYPFVSPFVSNTISDNSQLSEKTSVSEATQLLQQYISAKVGQQWFVAGIKFSTYNILESVALFALKFGVKIEVGLIGFSEINYPKGDKPLIHAHLALVASILPDDGIAAVNAQLTAESYLFSEKCKLTGGFAFYMWFGNNANSGDFVVTLGGYHPSFNVPAHYPQVPRLGFNWPITSDLNIKGEMYFALTPRCIMAGGRFEANYQSGNFRAWFIMGADFMIAWKPYKYDANMYVVFGVVYQFRLNLGIKTITKNISANFGAQLQVWGPDFSGKARIDLSVISFTINFGNSNKRSIEKIDWKEFKTSFLPENKNKISLHGVNNGVVLTSPFCSSKAISGIKIGTQNEIVQLSHENVVFEISTVIPNKCTEHLEIKNWETSLGVKPVGISSKEFSSELKVEVSKVGNSYNIIENFIIKEKLQNVAGALWNESYTEKDIVNNVLMGLFIEPKPVEKESAVSFALVSKIQNEKIIKVDLVYNSQNLVDIDKKNATLFADKAWI